MELPSIQVQLVDHIPTVSSLTIAQHFEKEHKDVLRAIQQLDCSPEFTERNFALSHYLDVTGRKLPMYHLTRDGFAFLVMGFTGRKAAVWKEAYINAFNAMEQTLQLQYRRVLQEAQLSPPARCLLAFLRYHSPLVEFSPTYIRENMSFNKSRLYKTLEELRRKGYLTYEQRFIKSGGRFVSADHKYCLKLEQGE